MSTELIVSGKTVELKKLPNAREFVAAQAGIVLPAPIKGAPLKRKDIVALCVAGGKTEAQVKAWYKEFDGVRDRHFIHSKMAVAMMAADPSIRTTLRPSINAKGKCIGGSATFRMERSAKQTAVNRIAQLEKQLAEALARVPALPA